MKATNESLMLHFNTERRELMLVFCHYTDPTLMRSDAIARDPHSAQSACPVLHLFELEGLISYAILLFRCIYGFKMYGCS